MYEAPAVSGAKWIPLIYKQPSDEGAKPQRDGHVNAPDAASWRRCRMAAVQPWADARRWGVYASPVSADGRLPSSFMDAAVQAYRKAQELGGVVTSLSQTDGDAVQAPRPQHDTRQDPVFWFRPRSDGGFEGPIHNSAMGDVRKTSGAWVGLYANHSPIEVKA